MPPLGVVAGVAASGITRGR